MLSRQALKVLRSFNSDKQFVEGTLPAGCDLALLQYLVDNKFLSESWLPSEGEPDYPYGRKIYRITSAGKEAVYNASDRKRYRRNERLFTVFLAFLTFILGLIAEHFTGLVTWLLHNSPKQ